MQPLFTESGLASADDGGDDAGGAVDAADAEAVLFAHIHVVMPVETQGVRHEGTRLHSRATVAVGGPLTIAQHGFDDPRGHVDLADAVVRVVAYVKIAPRIKGQMFGVPERRLRGRTAVPVIPLKTEIRSAVGPALAFLERKVPTVETGEACDDAGAGINPSDIVRPLTREIEVTVGCDGNAASRVHLSIKCRTTVSAPTSLARAGDSGDDSGFGVDAAENLTTEIPHVEITLAIETQIVRVADAGFAGRPPVPTIPGHTVAGKCVQNTVAIDAPDALPLIVVDDELTGERVSLRKAHHP